jgi:hypothetical protein
MRGKTGPLGQKYLEKTWTWFCSPVSPVFQRLRQEDHKFEASLGYYSEFTGSLSNPVRTCLKTKPKTNPLLQNKHTWRCDIQ